MNFASFRLGPLTGSWCMRYEAKHHYFKKLSTIIGNFMNLPYTLSMRHQQWMCYKSNSSGNFESSFLEKGIEVGSGTLYIIAVRKSNLRLNNDEEVLYMYA